MTYPELDSIAEDAHEGEGIIIRDEDKQCCEVCQSSFGDPQDVELNLQVMALLAREDAVRRQYNEYRRSKGLEPFEVD